METANTASLQTSTPQKITKAVAAERLGVSERTVLAMAMAGKVKATKERGENGQMAWSFDAGDIERYLWARSQSDWIGAGRVKSSTTKALVQVAQPLPAAIPLKPWMTIKEAAVYTGLPVSLFIQLINRKQLSAFDVGPRPGGRYRVSRAALDKLEESTLEASTKRKRFYGPRADSICVEAGREFLRQNEAPELWA
jgi:excisionase family DNA binding protein